jgi:predicted component of type VI protein secretion system
MALDTVRLCSKLGASSLALILEVKAGPFAGKRVAVMGGQTITIGRAPDRANFALPHDTFMSGLHFAVACGLNGCKLTDKSRNGTFVNGARVTEAFLNSGDEVRSGQTVFAVRMVAEDSIPVGANKPTRPAPTPPPPPQRASPARKEPAPLEPIAAYPVKKASPAKPVLAMGGWSFAAVPEGWAAQGEYGVQRSVQDSFPSNAVVAQEPLGSLSLQDYVEAQVGMLRQYLREPQIEAVLPPRIGGAEETVAIEVRYKTKDGQAVFYCRVYARAGQLVGVLTFTTLEGELAALRREFDLILSGASFAPTPGA